MLPVELGLVLRLLLSRERNLRHLLYFSYRQIFFMTHKDGLVFFKPVFNCSWSQWRIANMKDSRIFSNAHFAHHWPKPRDPSQKQYDHCGSSQSGPWAR